MTLTQWAGRDLGRRTVAYTERDVILYALAVGAASDQLDLVWERNLRPLPTFGLTLAQWAPDLLGQRGALDPATSLHAAQRFTALSPLPPQGTIEIAARVGAVWDRGQAAVVDVEVTSEHFEAIWSLHVPDQGGFGGPRSPRPPIPAGDPVDSLALPTRLDQPALYRLLGDRHAIHIQPQAAHRAGLDRPVMHGLCTLASAVLPLAAANGAHPCDLVELQARFTAPVYPGEQLNLDLWNDTPHQQAFQARRDDGILCLAAGRASFR